MAATMATGSNQDWIVLMLADSALPVGGFVSSGGLEAAVQLGHVQGNNVASLESFAHASLHNMAASMAPSIADVYGRLSVADKYSGLGSTRSDSGIAWGSSLDAIGRRSVEAVVDSLVAIDKRYDAFAGTNHVARRASTAQGIAYLTLVGRSFADAAAEAAAHDRSAHDSTAASLVVAESLKMRIRKGATPGHLPICYAVACHSLGISLDRAQSLILYLHARAIVSSAVRMNLIGPYLGQTLLYRLKTRTEGLLASPSARAPYASPEPEPEPGQTFDQRPRLTSSLVCGKLVDVKAMGVQTSPLVDVLQGCHDRLYSHPISTMTLTKVDLAVANVAAPPQPLILTEQRFVFPTATTLRMLASPSSTSTPETTYSIVDSTGLQWFSIYEPGARKLAKTLVDIDGLGVLRLERPGVLSSTYKLIDSLRGTSSNIDVKFSSSGVSLKAVLPLQSVNQPSEGGVSKTRDTTMYVKSIGSQGGVFLGKPGEEGSVLVAHLLRPTGFVRGKMFITQVCPELVVTIAPNVDVSLAMILCAAWVTEMELRPAPR
ncbi:hypothetical protein BC831DRAFT_503782 [Entophlyctis helioformis]|nr:hypothetical protein BC831DRAFT_503782 [Entophlyctis helioformis]